MAETKELKVGYTYYMPLLHTDEMYISLRWFGKAVEIMHLHRKLVYLNKEDAIEHTRIALLGKEQNG